ncbi:MAG: pyrroloquinoline quinone precursor peptide PqqA [Hyphomicrobiales bacterium]
MSVLLLTPLYRPGRQDVAGTDSRVLAFWCSRERPLGDTIMKWAKPTITELCIGLEINDYFPAEL